MKDTAALEKLAILGGAPLREEPFHPWPIRDAAEEAALARVLQSGNWGGYPSPNVEASAFAARFAEHCGAGYGVCCANGSVAIELALHAAGLAAGDEVIVPAYTFVATASSVAFCHGVPVFVDVDPETYCIDPAGIRAAITDKTRAIIVVHLACNMADMDAVAAIAKEHELLVIEDCAHAHGHRWRGRGAGSLGDLSTFSFQSSKLMTAGEGGIVLTSDDTLHQRLQSLVNCGRKEPGYDAYPGRVLGRNARLTEWQAALLSAQLSRLDDQTDRRILRAGQLQERLRHRPGLSFTRPHEANDRRAIYQFIVKYDPAGFAGLPRDRFLEALRAEGVPAEGDFYEPLTQDPLFALDPKTNPLAAMPYGQGYRLEDMACPVTAKAAYEEAIWLPHQLFLGSEADMDAIAGAFIKVQERAAELL